jgi:hypothetical protein
VTGDWQERNDITLWTKEISPLHSFLQPFKIREPQRYAGVARHPPVAARREGDATHFRAIRKAGTLELLGEETTVKDFQPAVDFRSGKLAGKGLARQAQDLARGELQAHDMVEKEVVQQVGTDMVLGHLADLTLFVGRQQLG